MFTEEGAFAGHFHTCVSGLSAIVVLSKELYKKGEQKYANELIDMTIKSYDWISENTEFCCTADMIELAAELAEVSEIIPGYEFLDRLWEDCERFTINELFAIRILHPEQI